MEQQDIAASKDNLELKSLFFKYLHYWYLFVLSLIVALGAWHYYMKYTVPVYQVKARFLVKAGGGNDNSLTGTQDIFSGLGAGISTSSNVSNELEILKSRYIVGKVVKALNLTVSYMVVGRIRSTELYDRSPVFLNVVSPVDSLPWESLTLKLAPHSDSYQIQTGENTFKRYRYNDTVFYDHFNFVVVPNPKGDFNEFLNINIAPYDATVTNYLGGIDAANINEGTVIQLSTHTTVPRKGEDIINTLYDVYANISLEDKNRVIDSTVKFIDQRMAILHQEISSAQDSITSFLITNKIAPPDASSLSTTIGNVVSNMGDVSNARYQLNLLDAFIEKIKAGGYPIVPSDMDLSNPDFHLSATTYNTLALSRIHYLEYSGSENPVLLDVENQINGAKINMLAAANSERSRYITLLNKVQKTYDMSNDSLSHLPAYQKYYQQISNGLDIELQLYDMLLNKRESLDIFRAGTSSNSKLIDAAKCDDWPISPKGGLVRIMAVAIGLVVPVVIITLIGLFDNKIRSKKEVLDIVNVPIVGEVGHNTSSTELVVVEKSRSVLAEQFRILRTNLQFMTSGSSNIAIVVTSSMSGEGKSFTSINMALSLAISGKKTLIMEMDLRKPQISRMLNISMQRHGYVNYMISDISPDDIVRPSGVDDNLFVVSSGPIPPNPSELLMQPKTSLLLAELKKRFDYIIIDTAPIGLVTDGFILSKLTNATVYLIRQNYTLKGQIVSILKNVVEERKILNVGVVINDITSGKGYGYGHGYGYGYGYGYGTKNKGYYVEEDKSSLRSKIKALLSKIIPFKRK